MQKPRGESRAVFSPACPWKSVGPPAIQDWEPETSSPALLGPNAEAAAASVRSGKSLYQALGLQNTTFLGFLLGGWTASCLWLSHTQHQPALPPSEARWAQHSSLGLGRFVPGHRNLLTPPHQTLWIVSPPPRSTPDQYSWAVSPPEAKGRTMGNRK